MSIRIVSHCYAAKLKQYAVDLRYQLSSLVLYKPEVPTFITICYTYHDDRTIKVLREFQSSYKNELNLRLHGMSGPELFRRSIGRNRVALESSEDLIWFADVDYIFQAGCLDQLWKVWQSLPDPKPAVVYPKNVKIHETHEAGDALINGGADVTGLIELDTSKFIDKGYSRAIGGVQITNGEYARTYGYLKHSQKYQKPITEGRMFHTTEDTAFRHHAGVVGTIKGIEFDGLYRIRHYLNAYQRR